MEKKMKKQVWEQLKAEFKQEYDHVQKEMNGLLMEWEGVQK
jgi:hypothetical protein